MMTCLFRPADIGGTRPPAPRRPLYPALLLAWVSLGCALGLTLRGGELLIGGATLSITPNLPVALDGQMHLRIAQQVESPVTATALAIESRSGDSSQSQAILVSCDLVAIRQGLAERVRDRARDRLPGFDLDKLLLTATHTHTAPVTEAGRYAIPAEVLQPEAYATFLIDRLAEVAVAAWENRRPGAVGWGLGHAVTAYNRRSVYADGRAQMYGATDRPDFRGLEGPEDQGVEVLFFWDRHENLIATAINIASPAQEVEGRSAINADFWHEVREQLRARYGPDLLVLGWIGAAGDQSPRPMFRRAAEDRMRQLRQLTRLDEIAGRIVHAWEEAHAGARLDMRTEPPFRHLTARVHLAPRHIRPEEFAEARNRIAALTEGPDFLWRQRWHQSVVDRYQRQEAGEAQPVPATVHVLRLGDVAIATNEFELFTEFGIQLKARSPALQTFVVQLAGSGGYIPTSPAVRGGGYSAVAESNRVGPQGGQELVEHTLRLIESLWAAD